MRKNRSADVVTSSHHDSDEEHDQEDLEDSEDDWKPEKVTNRLECLLTFHFVNKPNRSPFLFAPHLLQKKGAAAAKGKRKSTASAATPKGRGKKAKKDESEEESEEEEDGTGQTISFFIFFFCRKLRKIAFPIRVE